MGNNGFLFINNHMQKNVIFWEKFIFDDVFGLILLKNHIQGFLGSLNTNPVSDFENSKWRIQNGGLMNENSRKSGFFPYFL